MTDRWDRYFLRLAATAAEMSKDPSTNVGAIVVGPDKDIRATGFNGFPRGVADTRVRLDTRPLKLELMVHAEMNCICHAARAGHSLKGCTIYIDSAKASLNSWIGPPCIRCTVHLIQAGIAEIVTWQYLDMDIPARWKDDVRQSHQLIFESGIIYRTVPRPV